MAIRTASRKGHNHPHSDVRLIEPPKLAGASKRLLNRSNQTPTFHRLIAQQANLGAILSAVKSKNEH
jgi:hypothetical protein